MRGGEEVLQPFQLDQDLGTIRLREEVLRFLAPHRVQAVVHLAAK